MLCRTVMSAKVKRVGFILIYQLREMELAVSLANICRTCLSGKSAELFCVLDGTDGDSLAEILSKCCDIQVDADETPTKICSACKRKLIAFYEFKKSCIQNDLLLRRVVLKSLPSLDSDSCIDNKENVAPAACTRTEDSQSVQICVETSGKNSGSNVACETGHIEQDSGDENSNIPGALKPYVCKQCGKCFEKCKNLYRHEKIHDGQKPYLCSACGKCFSQSNNLQAHMRIHSGSKPYSCTECSKSFAQWSTLQTHLVTHTGERAFICSVCGKTFARRNSLTKHSRTHTAERKYACNVCNKSFKTSSERTQHLVTHTGEKKHVCTVCGKSFNRASNLTVHKKIHTGVRPHLCRICGKRFIQVYVLNNHIKTHVD